ncbi:max dimerization protein 3-like isoform X2 [Halichondria panicea]|uniref:max dimerization protein 3-like isoform X2 n=1 Tax=Halichondria panicea TaxID=6063 RepID=UPI00312BBCC3
MSLEDLIQAAQFLEQNGRSGDEDLEESPKKRSRPNRQKRPASYSAMARSRTTHNLLEKNRRAQLRDCLEVLRQHVPLPDKLTTLALLQSAKKYIESLKKKERKEKELKTKLQNDQSALLSRLAELGAGDYVQALSGEGTTEDPAVAPSSPATDLRNSLLEVSDIVVDEPNKTGVSNAEEEDNVVIDVLSNESDDNSSTTSGSDGGCTSTSHKYAQLAA